MGKKNLNKMWRTLPIFSHFKYYYSGHKLECSKSVSQ
uniref:Uncharacterized protein n=1 Tax=Anguilla anguilla TaxID=7936 RepID=A0A0E9WPE0_ANGAN